MNILLVKESREGEKRVGLVPDDVKLLIEDGHKIFVEHGAGDQIGFNDDAYIKVGAEIRCFKPYIEAAKDFFKDIDFIVRVKRPNRKREIIENKTIVSGTAMVGALDKFETETGHVNEYREQGIIGYSIDQLKVLEDDPMNILTSMSEIAGRLALKDAVRKYNGTPKKAVIIGYGIAGKAAFKEAVRQDLETTVILRNEDLLSEIEKNGGHVVLQKRSLTIAQQRNIIADSIVNADIIVTSARKSGEKAPVLITGNMLEQMNTGTVIVDLAMSEGGNVEGSLHDKALVLGNGIIVANVSGYPKDEPLNASLSWSRANLFFIRNYEKTI